MTFRLVRELAADGVSVAVACRVLNVSRSGFYDWSTRPPSARSLADAELTTTILQVHAMSRCSYGLTSPTGLSLEISRAERAADVKRAPDLR